MKTQRLLAGALAASCLLLATGGLLGQGQGAGARPEIKDAGEISQKTEKAVVKKPVSAEVKFIHRTSNINVFNQGAGELAIEKSPSKAIKAFGRKLADESMISQKQLTQTAGEMGIMLPPQLDKRHEHLLGVLRSGTGNSFDQAFLRNVITENEICVAHCETQSKIADKPALQKYAANMIPTLQSRLTKARELYAEAQKPVVVEPAGIEKFKPRIQE